MIVRRYQPGEEEEIWNLYFDTTRRVNSRHYTQSQIERWAPEVHDEREWRERIRHLNPFVAARDGEIMGFAELEPNGHIERFYVRWDRQRQGVGRALLRAVEEEGRSLRVSALFAEVSITAEPFFTAMGFEIAGERARTICGAPARQYLMRKALEGAESNVRAVTIRHARPEDAASIARVHVETWLATYRGLVSDSILDNVSIAERTRKWQERLSVTGGRPAILVADRQHEVVGFISGGKNRQSAFPFDSELYALYVRPASQHQRVGQNLAATLVGELRASGFRNLLVGVFTANMAARRFYEALGAHHLGEQPLVWQGHSYPESFYGWDSLDDCRRTLG